MAQANIKKSLEMLLKLQEIDSLLAELGVSKVYFPKLIEQLKTEIEELEKKSRVIAQNVVELKRQLRMKELSLKEAKERLKKSQERLSTVQSNKEYDAVQHEIKAFEEAIAQHEEEMIRLMEDLEIAEKDERAIAENLVEKRESNKKEIEYITENFSEIENKVKEIQESRKKYSAEVDRHILRRYEQISDGTNGLAVVKVVRRACGGCFHALPPKQIQEIRRLTSVSICETCGRILVWENDVSE